MKAVLVLFVLTCTLALAYGNLVCGTNYCKHNPCVNNLAPSSCLPPSVYHEKHAGQCGCCPACVTLLPEGAACKVYTRELGETPSSICSQPHLKCINGFCAKVALRV